MKALGFGLLLSFLGLPNANADPIFYNATPSKCTVLATYPNGSVQKRNITGSSPGISSEYFLTAPGVDSLRIEITDDTGASLWKGTVNKDDVTVLMPDGKGVKVVYAGMYGGPEGPRAAVFMNLTGAPLTIDLEGNNGVGAHRGIVVPGNSWDLNKMVRLDPKESTFSVVATGAKGKEPIKVSNVVTPGYYVMIWRTSAGELRAQQFGKIVAKK